MGKKSTAKRAPTRQDSSTVNGSGESGTGSGSFNDGVETTTTTPARSPSPVSPTSPAPPTPPIERTPEEDAKEAEEIKEKGNAVFKAGKYQDAIELYTQAIQLNSQETSYLTNRAASYMALKKFRPALEDCQQALAILSSASTSAPGPSTSSSTPTNVPALSKTLLRLARCQYALGQTTPALSTLSQLASIESPLPGPAQQLKNKITLLEQHVENFASAKTKRDWPMARLALDKCMQAIDAEGGDVPSDWRVWKVELELARGNWEAAGFAANDALRLSPTSSDALTLRGLVLFLSGRLPNALQHLQSALKFDPGHVKAQQLRKRVKDVERLKEEGNTVFKAGNYEEAVKLYGEALDRIGSNEEEGYGGQIRATLLSNRATTLLKLGQHESALEDTSASLKLFPHSFKALRTQARIYLALEKYEEAVQDFKSAVNEAQSEGSASDADVRALKSELKKAEVALKRSKTKDYYKILGVSRECTEVEIKKAYRRESLKHHPDKGGDEEKFKLVVEAHAVLSDPQRRRRYDLGEDEDGSMSGDGFGGMGGFGGGGFGGMGGMSPADLENLFAQFHGHGGGRGGFSF